MTQQQKVDSLYLQVVLWRSFFVLQSESKREEFRRYLEGAGVLDAFTKGDNYQIIEIMQWYETPMIH